MRKFIVLMAMCIMVISSTPSFAYVGIKLDNVGLGTATDLKFLSADQSGINKAFTFDGSLFKFNLLLAGTGTSGATSLGTGNTNVERGFSIVYKAIAASANETGFIHNGLPGEIVTIIATEVGAAGDWTLSRGVSSGGTSITWDTIIFNAVDDAITLLYISDAVGWIQVGSASATVVRIPF